MTLSAFARLAGVPPKWVLNTLRALDLTPRYTLARAQRFTVMRAVHEGAGMPLPAAYATAPAVTHGQIRAEYDAVFRALANVDRP